MPLNLQAPKGYFSGLWASEQQRMDEEQHQVSQASAIVDLYDKALDHEMKSYGFNEMKSDEAVEMRSAERQAKTGEARQRAYVAAQSIRDEEMMTLNAMRQTLQEDPTRWDDIKRDLPKDFAWVNSLADFDQAYKVAVESRETKQKMALMGLDNRFQLERMAKNQEYVMAKAKHDAQTLMEGIYLKGEQAQQLSREEWDARAKIANDIYAFAHQLYKPQYDEAGNDMAAPARDAFAMGAFMYREETARAKATTRTGGESPLQVEDRIGKMKERERKGLEDWAKGAMGLKKEKDFNHDATGYTQVTRYFDQLTNYDAMEMNNAAQRAKDLWYYDGDMFLRLPEDNRGRLAITSSRLAAWAKEKGYDFDEAYRAYVNQVANQGYRVRNSIFDEQVWKPRGNPGMTETQRVPPANPVPSAMGPAS